MNRCRNYRNYRPYRAHTINIRTHEVMLMLGVFALFLAIVLGAR